MSEKWQLMFCKNKIAILIQMKQIFNVNGIRIFEKCGFFIRVGLCVPNPSSSKNSSATGSFTLLLFNNHITKLVSTPKI